MKLINPEVRIENTNFCNSKCVICPREKMTRKRVFMPQSHFEYLVDQAKDLGATLISIFGYGEPLLDTEIHKKVQYCTDKGLETFITTNASLLGVDTADRILKAGLSKIRFSVHGFFNTYDEVHKNLSWYETMRNIGNFTASVKKEYADCKISVSVIPTNNEELEHIKYFWREHDLEVWKPHNWTDGRAYRPLTEKRKKTCGRPFSGPVQINADGKMMVCCFDFNGIIIVGDTYKQTIEDGLKSGAFNEIREKHKAGNLAGLPCETCDQLNVGDDPLIYSTIDPECKPGKTSSAKFDLTCDECN